MSFLREFPPFPKHTQCTTSYLHDHSCSSSPHHSLINTTRKNHKAISFPPPSLTNPNWHHLPQMIRFFHMSGFAFRLLVFTFHWLPFPRMDTSFPGMLKPSQMAPQSHYTALLEATLQCHLHWVLPDSEKRQLTWSNEKLGSTSPCEFFQYSSTGTVWQLFTKWASSFSHLSGCWRPWIPSVMNLSRREAVNTHTDLYRPPPAPLCKNIFFCSDAWE